MDLDLATPSEQENSKFEACRAFLMAGGWWYKCAGWALSPTVPGFEPLKYIDFSNTIQVVSCCRPSENV
jgi:hypothetical protein